VREPRAHQKQPAARPQVIPKTNFWSFDFLPGKTTTIVISWVEIAKGVAFGVFSDVVWRSMGALTTSFDGENAILVLVQTRIPPWKALFAIRGCFQGSFADGSDYLLPSGRYVAPDCHIRGTLFGSSGVAIKKSVRYF